jgi:hypothetical protein
LAICSLWVSIGVGVGIGIDIIPRDVWRLIFMHRLGPSDIFNGRAGHIQFLVSKGHADSISTPIPTPTPIFCRSVAFLLRQQVIVWFPDISVFVAIVHEGDTRGNGKQRSSITSSGLSCGSW